MPSAEIEAADVFVASRIETQKQTKRGRTAGDSGRQWNDEGLEGALTHKERSSLELTDLERAAEHSGSGWKAQRPTPSPLATGHSSKSYR